MKRTIEIDDTLQETVDQAISELKDCIRDYIFDNIDIDSLCLSNDIDYDGRFHEIVDGCVPIYTDEIDGLWYLYKHEFVEAFENAGVDGDSRDNNGMVAIYYYIEQKCWDWWHENTDEIDSMLLECELDGDSTDEQKNEFINSIECLNDE